MEVINVKKSPIVKTVSSTNVVSMSASNENGITFHIYSGSPEFPINPDLLFNDSPIVSSSDTLRVLKSALDENIFSEFHAEENIPQRAG